ncbi:molybdenum cofactor guanylyltransferase [Anaerobacillus arseniciselenatis]|uniref:Probable molybdenum cofactor guanylyltransferase n=1 Tax=Anaerobacillus arseniciselenatis TaxID=85682 RepID=A0A1S2LHT9_9BACI|nr:molybdenum cofactor guanylyltransferase [Anaerobacillus arseniciselenatis]OIJ11643.1 molybdenum cofactor guanylyltransferase [Anaerobacillus arseniciselenatis]
MDAGVIILAGGKSSRMGQNKALLPINGLANIERIKNQLASTFENIILVTNDKEKYRFLNIPTVSDNYQNKGPLAGIEAGLSASNNDVNIVVACDMPFVSDEIAQFLVQESEGFDAVIPVINGKQHPLFAVYKKTVLSEVTECIQSDQLRLKHLLQRMKVNYISEEKLLNKEIDNIEQVFYNMNHPSEYEEAKKLAEK